jgi:L-amino acid N-acyltransferase YncA
MPPLYKIRLAGAADAEPIRAIRNDVIERSTAMWTTELVTPGGGQAWLAENLARRSAYVAEFDGQVIGYANWAPWRPKDGYRHTVEDSVYLTEGHQGHGLGAELLRTLITAASDSGAHVMMASIESSNARSVALHQRLGFEVVGTAREVGTKFGRWLDLTMMRLPLSPSGIAPPIRCNRYARSAPAGQATAVPGEVGLLGQDGPHGGEDRSRDRQEDGHAERGRPELAVDVSPG